MATIFVLDGNAGSREHIVECLRKRKHRVESFSTISGLKQALLGQAPDILVLEARLPDGDGFQLVRKLKSDNCIPIVFVTYCSSTQERIEGLETGADDYVVKPFLPRELEIRIEGILRRYNCRQ
ncbi:MAG: response regulator transcription factor [Spirochaetes bacterium]|nr:response regulator transcription factor [Spirochaetota bacterium]